MTYIDKVKARLLAKRLVDSKTGCWLWTGPFTKDGYGTTSLFTGKDRVSALVHRVAAYVFKDFDIYSKTCVLHRCDNPPCFNPSHLFYGSQADNVRDCASKGRRNQRRPLKLNPDKVRAIRRLRTEGWEQPQIGKLFGITQATVSSIVLGKSWRDIQ